MEDFVKNVNFLKYSKFGDKGRYQVFLKKVEVPIVENDRCQELLRETRLGEDFILDSGFMCAGDFFQNVFLLLFLNFEFYFVGGEENVDACTGDGGGALACPIPGKPNFFYQAGIIVGGIGCGTKNVPAFYLNVKKYLPWIEQQISLKGFNL